MKILALLMIAFLLFSMIFISGCIATSNIQNQEEAATAVGEVSENVENIEGILEELDEDLT